MKTRCAWAGNDELYVRYHDEEWGVPLYDDQKLFEFLILEGAQAGLSWSTILNKRNNYREAFDHFDIRRMAAYGPDKISELMQNPGIVRNKLKIDSAIRNARACLQIQKQGGSFSDYLWQFVGGKPLTNHWKSLNDLPAKTEISDKMSRALKNSGFNFVGSTICYAFMQAVGMVNDHTTDCFRYKELSPYR